MTWEGVQGKLQNERIRRIQQSRLNGRIQRWWVDIAAAVALHAVAGQPPAHHNGAHAEKAKNLEARA